MAGPCFPASENVIKIHIQERGRKRKGRIMWEVEVGREEKEREGEKEKVVRAIRIRERIGWKKWGKDVF